MLASASVTQAALHKLSHFCSFAVVTIALAAQSFGNRSMQYVEGSSAVKIAASSRQFELAKSNIGRML